MNLEEATIFEEHLAPFRDLEPLRARVLMVLRALPTEVIDDFRHDPRFSVAVDNYVPGEGSTVFMAAPGPGKNGSRSVVLRPRLAECSEAFALYVIAHEFAHAYLRNGPWGTISDVEQAADALASHWGFARPT